jgi:ATP-dependent Clp protease ATP-binding subunit ClpA
MNRFKSFWQGLNTPLVPERKMSDDSPANFTPRAQQVLTLARKEANRFNHNFVGTEHLLLGLIRLGQGTAVAVLQRLGLDLENVRIEVERQVGVGPDRKPLGLMPYTPRVKKVLVLAAKEARALNHTYVGTEHILLGLLREGNGVAARVLLNLGVNTDQVRQEVLRELDPNFQPSDKDAEAMQSNAQSANLQGDEVDTSKRYDIYCREIDKIVVYRKALFRSCKDLLSKDRFDISSQFVEIEQSDGQIVFVARSSIFKFCEHGITPGSETDSD